MSNLPQQDTLRQYQADGVTTSYVYQFLILINSDITVYVTPSGQAANPTNDIKVLDVDYTVTGAGNATGGNVVFTIAPALGSIVTLERTMQISIDTNFSLAQNFNGANLDAAFERITLFTQQTNTLLQTRALQYIVNSYLPNVNSNQVPTLADGQVWSGLGGAIVATDIENNPDISLLRSELASSAPLADGSLLVGYYDTINSSGTTIGKYLDYKDIYGSDTGTADAMVLTIPNSNFDYANGQTVHIVVANDNVTTTPTLNVNGKGAIVIKRNPISSAQAGDLSAGTIADLLYDSSANNFYIINLFVPQTSPTAPTMQSFTVAGSSGTYTTPAGVTYIEVFGVGGGAGSGAAQGGSNEVAASGGGGGGGYFFKRITSPAATYAYAIGSGGTATVSIGTNGTPTTFGVAFLTANGGIGSGLSSAYATISYPGGAGGTATGGDININGDAGTASTGNIAAASGINCVSGGNGGKSYLGSSSVGASVSRTNSSVGNNGINYGGGASGCATCNSASVLGANGAGGAIFVFEYYV